jgi:hypothetical protein
MERLKEGKRHMFYLEIKESIYISDLALWRKNIM